jgi:hypothetical protein
MKSIILTEQEANTLLSILSELPIKYLSTVNVVRDMLVQKFKASSNDVDREENYSTLNSQS